MINEETWPQLYNSFTPQRRLWGDEVTQYHVERPHAPLDSLKVHLALNDQRVLLFGHTGSGKSSELARLVNDVEDDFFIVWIDSERNLDIFDATQVELLFLIGISIFQVAETGLPDGKTPDSDNQKRLITGLETLVQTQTSDNEWKLDVGQLVSSLAVFGLGTAAALGAGPAAGIATAGVTKAGLELVKNAVPFKVGGQRDEVRKLEVRPEIHTILGAVNDIINDVANKSPKPLLLIVDGLDKFELDQSKNFFIHSQVLNMVDCATIYVTPLTLYYSPDFSQARQQFRIEEFPNIALSSKGNPDETLEASYAIFHEVVDRRLAPLNLSRSELFATDALTQLIKMSGGVMREFIRLVQTALVEMRVAKMAQVSLEHAQDAIFRERRSYKAGLKISHYEELDAFMQRGIPSETETCDELLRNLYILSYSNDDLWYDIHPTVKPLLQEWRRNRDNDTQILIADE